MDISSVSTSAFARHSDQWMLLPDLSISCYGRVLSVLLVSRHPFEELQKKTVLLTEESATAVDLVKLIFSILTTNPTYDFLLFPNQEGELCSMHSNIIVETK